MVGACANICHNQWGSATEATDNPESSFIECLGERDAAVLRSLAARRKYPAGSTLFFEADPAHDVIVVERGEVSILVTAIDGRELVIDVFGPGSLLGELSAIDGASRSASAVAIGEVEVIAVPTARFSEFLDAHPRAQRVLLQLLAERLRGATRRHLEFGTSDALGRVCARVDEMARRYGRTSEEGLVIESPMSQAELANWAGLSREAVVKALRALRALGWIESRRNTIIVRDLVAIRARAARP